MYCLKSILISSVFNANYCNFSHSLCDEEILLNPLLVFDLHNGAEHIKDGSSYSNKLECQLIVKICKTLLEVASSSNIGIITPYKAQTRMIQTYIKSRYSSS